MGCVHVYIFIEFNAELETKLVELFCSIILTKSFEERCLVDSDGRHVGATLGVSKSQQ